MILKRTLIVLACFLFVAAAVAQVEAEPAEAIQFAGPNKGAYVVVSVIAVTLLGIFALLFSTDRKVRRLENQVQNKKG